jgi:hypothetical protein
VQPSCRNSDSTKIRPVPAAKTARPTSIPEVKPRFCKSEGVMSGSGALTVGEGSEEQDADGDRDDRDGAPAVGRALDQAVQQPEHGYR